MINHTKLSLVQGDITKQTTDAIVNAANSSLMVVAVWTAQYTALVVRQSLNSVSRS